VDISHPEFEDHIASVNQTLLDIKQMTNQSLWFLIKSIYKHLTIDEDDLMTEKLKHYTLQEWKLLGWVVGENALLFRQQIKRILKNLENACTKRCDTFTLLVSLHKFLYPDYKDAIEKKTKTKKKSSNFLYNINILILLSHH
jgi:GTP-binding protein HflX